MQFNNDSNKRLPCADNPVKLGNVYGDFNGCSFAGNVWGKESMSPCLNSMNGGGRQPMVVVYESNSNSKGGRSGNK